MQDKLTEHNPLGVEPVGRLIIAYAVPSIISFVVNSLYNMVDQIFIGQGVGYLGNAATNIILPLSTILLAFGTMLGSGAATFISLNLGQGDPETAGRGAGNTLTLTLLTGLVLLALTEGFLAPLCRVFGATDDIMPYALDYGQIIVAAAPVSLACMTLSNIIRADGRPRISMIGLLIGCGTNMVLDPIFVLGFHWGVKGAAWATIIGQALNVIYNLLHLRTCNTIQIKKQDLFLRAGISVRLVIYGMSSFIMQAASVLLIFVLNNSLVSYGALSKYGAEIPLAAFGIAIKVGQILTGIAIGIAMGIQPILGFNYGSRQYGRVKQTYKLAMISSTLVLMVSFLIFEIFPEKIVLLFGQESQLYMEFAVKSFRCTQAACFLIGVSAVTGTFFQAIGKPIQSALLSLARQVLFLIPAILIFGILGGIEGVLWACPFSDAASAVVSALFIWFYWKRLFPACEPSSCSSVQ